MPLDRLAATLDRQVDELHRQGTAKGDEAVVTGVVPAAHGHGPRYVLEGDENRRFIRMNSNSYLGMALRPEVKAAEEEGTARYGAGPGAVRFISGTFRPHVDLERRLAEFHGRQAAMLFSSAYAAIVGVIAPLLSAETVVISDELNHNCIINAIKMARPQGKAVYPHNDLGGLEAELARAADSGARRAVVVTDGIFSMRGDHAPLAGIVELARRFDDRFAENVVVLVDDSHGVGALGEGGRGTEEHTGARADVLVATLGKALGVNGGYVTAEGAVIRYLRETAPMYIYSNPITAGEACAARAALDLLDSAEGRELLARLGELTRRFERGLTELGYEIIPGDHPVVPLMVRDTAKTRELVAHLREGGVLATGLAYPVVPRGAEEIRFQVCADHTEDDVDQVLRVLEAYPGRGA